MAAASGVLLWLHLAVTALVLGALHVAGRVIVGFYRVFPFPLLLDWLFVHGPRGLRSVFSFRLHGGRPDAQRVVGASDPRLSMRSAQLIRHEGYVVEEHSVETKDGFVLGMQRIPFRHGEGRSSSMASSSSRRPAVLLQHGLMQCSEVWLTNGREGSLAFILADAGFDVWLGNNRGNTYSAKHTRLRADTPEYWDWSLDEMARYDLPAMVAHMKRCTGLSTVGYVGFSQGTAQAFAALSSNADFAASINMFAALSAAATVRGLSRSLVSSLISADIRYIYAIFGQRAMLSSALTWQRLLSTSLFVRVIDASLAYLFQWTTTELNPLDKPCMYSHLYSYSSVKSCVHWFDIIRSGRFQMCNDLYHDRAVVATAYDLSVVRQRCPVAVFIGGRDTTIDGERLVSELGGDSDGSAAADPATSGSPTTTYSKAAGLRPLWVHREPRYEHLDFLWATSARQRAFPALVEHLHAFAPCAGDRRSGDTLPDGGLDLPIAAPASTGDAPCPTPPRAHGSAGSRATRRKAGRSEPPGAVVGGAVPPTAH